MRPVCTARKCTGESGHAALGSASESNADTFHFTVCNADRNLEPSLLAHSVLDSGRTFFAVRRDGMVTRQDFGA